MSLKQGFAVSGKASEAGKKGQATRKKKMLERKRRGEKQHQGGFKKGSEITKLYAALAIKERWRRFYENKAKELEVLASTQDPKEVEERFKAALASLSEEKRAAFEAAKQSAAEHEAAIRNLQAKIRAVEAVEKREGSVVFGRTEEK